MAPLEFDTWQAYQQFSHEILGRRRYLRSTRSEVFLETVRETTGKRVFSVDPTEVFWRAIGEVEQIEIADSLPRFAPCGLIRTMPLAAKAHEGRVNPKGIPCLYVATQPSTAVGEVRPALGKRVTLACVVPTRALKLVNCGSEKASPAYSEEPSTELREAAVWAHISTAFSEPVERADDHADYAPTQVLAELFKEMGLDGIAYRSAFGIKGYNVAIFKPQDCAVTGRWVYRVAGIEHEVNIDPEADRSVDESFATGKIGSDWPPSGRPDSIS